MFSLFKNSTVGKLWNSTEAYWVSGRQNLPDKLYLICVISCKIARMCLFRLPSDSPSIHQTIFSSVTCQHSWFAFEVSLKWAVGEVQFVVYQPWMLLLGAGRALRCGVFLRMRCDENDRKKNARVVCKRKKEDKGQAFTLALPNIQCQPSHWITTGVKDIFSACIRE